ncbi:hypothetical protein QT972_26865 [Microcoleus sp. herbarium7]|uniref:hypothetical protein n=1 Tax=Microcoleus sp. herbarium7 TaxID=3055435 RepID=UPI002FD57F10
MSSQHRFEPKTRFMEIVHSLDLEQSIAHTNLKPWRAPGGFFCWGLTEGVQIGYLTTPECRARLSYNFKGFQVMPCEGFVSVAPIKPPNQPMRFHLGEWVAATDPVFVSCETIRETLPRWSGSIKFILKIEQIPKQFNLSINIPTALAGSTPFVSEVKLGFSVAISDMVDYALSFALPDRLGKSVNLTRTANVGSDGISLALPPGIAKDKIEAVSFLIPDQYLLGANVEAAGITLHKKITPGTRGVLLFLFTPTVEAAGEIFQVSDIPSIALMSIEEQNRQYIVVPEWVKSANQKEFKWDAAYTFDQVVEVVAIAQEGKDARAICDKLLAIVGDRETAFLEMHPWGKKIPISIAGGVDSGSKIRTLPGLSAQSFRMVLGGLVRGAIGTVKGS